MRHLILALALVASLTAPAMAGPNLLRQADIRPSSLGSTEISTIDEVLLGYLPVGNVSSPVSVWVTTACTGTAALDWYIAGMDSPPTSSDASTLTTYQIEDTVAAQASISSNGVQPPVKLDDLHPCGYVVFIGVSSNPPSHLCTVSITTREQRWGIR